ncbi:hypothetical protein Jann_1346 [Jannaschia sp. CCS1]|nr:hypothetical protein Jann_1346 [Jannaschia sp. CCS1]
MQIDPHQRGLSDGSGLRGRAHYLRCAKVNTRLPPCSLRRRPGLGIAMTVSNAIKSGTTHKRWTNVCNEVAAGRLRVRDLAREPVIGSRVG